MKHYVYLLGGNTLTAVYKEPIKKDDNLVDEFDADVHCDFVMNMIRVNDRLGHPDSYWTKVEEFVNKEGI